MLAARRGRIVNIASTAGLVGGKYIAAYAAAKHGVVGLTRALATELAAKGHHGERALPGVHRVGDARPHARPRSWRRRAARRKTPPRALLARNPLGRFVRPEEVAAAVVWLCLPGAGAITGQAIAIDGGEVQH